MASIRRAAGPAAIALLLFLAACAHTDPTDGAPAASPLIRFYRGPLDHLSSVRQGQCPMHPSCSEYADQAIAKHGPLIGWTMALDRLMRCGRDETRRNRKIRVNGDVLFYDPVEENDEWWFRSQTLFGKKHADHRPGAHSRNSSDFSEQIPSR